MNLTPRQRERFRATVLGHYRDRARDLPWRRSVTPYRVFVSEVMLQQTQVGRIVEAFPRFVRRFPSFARLAAASRAEVLAEWSGLGYNRRGVWLHDAARRIVDDHRGRLPRDPAVLATLPGIGHATAASIAVYAFNAPVAFIETNVRAVYLHHFFAGDEKVPDRELLPLVEATLDREDPRRWYSALMDYGTEMKKAHGNPARRSRAHRPQAGFSGSNREARGGAVRALLAHPPGLDAAGIAAATGIGIERIQRALEQLAAEGMITRCGTRWIIADAPQSTKG